MSRLSPCVNFSYHSSELFCTLFFKLISYWIFLSVLVWGIFLFGVCRFSRVEFRLGQVCSQRGEIDCWNITSVGKVPGRRSHSWQLEWKFWILMRKGGLADFDSIAFRQDYIGLMVGSFLRVLHHLRWEMKLCSFLSILIWSSKQYHNLKKKKIWQNFMLTLYRFTFSV